MFSLGGDSIGFFIRKFLMPIKACLIAVSACKRIENNCENLIDVSLVRKYQKYPAKLSDITIFHSWYCDEFDHEVRLNFYLDGSLLPDVWKGTLPKRGYNFQSFPTDLGNIEVKKKGLLMVYLFLDGVEKHILPISLLGD